MDWLKPGGMAEQLGMDWPKPGGMAEPLGMDWPTSYHRHLHYQQDRYNLLYAGCLYP
jgi:hypothetical protein